MCFLPNSRASIDQAPGPIIAKVAPRIASIRGTSGSPTRNKTIHSSTMVTSAPRLGSTNLRGEVSQLQPQWCAE